MRKYLIIGLVALMGFLTSCETKNVCYFNKKTVDLVVKSADWKFDKELNQFYVHFNVPAITAEVYNYGEFSVHREYSNNKNEKWQVALPQSLYLSEEVTTEEGTTTVYYQQLVDYRIGIGYAEIQVTNSDFYYEGYTPEDMLFRLQLTY